MALFGGFDSGARRGRKVGVLHVRHVQLSNARLHGGAAIGADFRRLAFPLAAFAAPHKRTRHSYRKQLVAWDCLGLHGFGPLLFEFKFGSRVGAI